MFLNESRNHHYLSQTEQRLNAMNPSADARNQRIFAFEVSDREKPVLNIVDQRGTRIESNLSCLDLFSFNVVDSRYRMNLESSFGKYEREAAQKSRALVEKLRTGSVDIKTEILDVFAIKQLNFFRNPYCVTKTMNTFGVAANYSPTDPELKAAYDAVLIGSRPHASAVCKKFDLTPELYEGWLRALFVLLAPVATNNIFEELIRTQFAEHYVAANVFDYTLSDASDVCLLSDRGFNTVQETKNTWVIEFNLSSRTFVCFYLSTLGEYDVPTQIKAKMKGQTSVNYTQNDRRLLAAYNRRTAYQCAKKVFAASASPRLAVE
jgi:hypothetical protein